MGAEGGRLPGFARDVDLARAKGVVDLSSCPSPFPLAEPDVDCLRSRTISEVGVNESEGLINGLLRKSGALREYANDLLD
jgi:hypothetical protein